MTNTTLIAELEKAEKGSREFDEEISRLDPKWSDWDPPHSCCPYYTTNLQDTIALVPEGWRVYALQQSHHGDLRWYAGIDKVYAAGNVNSGVIDGGPALALCIAILKSMEIGA